MFDVSVGEHDGKADFTMLPITDLYPNDYSCVYSTLVFIVNQAKQLNVRTPCLTFDMPLWLKAMDILNAESFDVVLILGGFHTLTSFVGSTGALIKGCHLLECLEMEFGTNTVPKIVDGKAISRAIRAHFLTEGSFMSKLLVTFVSGTGIEFKETEAGKK